MCRALIYFCITLYSFNTSAIADNVSFSGFNVTTTGSTVLDPDNALRLTTFGSFDLGYAFITTPIPINPNTSFITKFTYSAHVGGSSSNIKYAADGITFMIQNDPAGLNLFTGFGGGMGYDLSTNNMSISFREFHGTSTPNLDAAELRINGDHSNPIATAKTLDPFELVTQNETPRYVWIDYDGPTDHIQIYLSSNNLKPATPLIDNYVDLAAQTGGQAYVGFAATTGSPPSVHSATHRILNWDFSYSNVIEVTIDVKPGDPNNTINIESAGSFPIAILSTSTFDATEINPASITLAGARVKLVGKSDHSLCSKEDINADTYIDLKCKIVTAELIIEEGESNVTLEAETFSGNNVHGSDILRIVP